MKEKSKLLAFFGASVFLVIAATIGNLIRKM
jgi:hypothetical protein